MRQTAQRIGALLTLLFLVPLIAACGGQQTHKEQQHEQAAFGVLNGDWSPRPAFNAIQSFPKR